MKDNLTELVLIVDRSGSMATIRKDAQGGFDEFIKKQKEVEGEARITLTEFDSQINVVCENIDIKEMKPYKLEPRGSTALLDAIGQTINKIGKRLSETKEEDRPSKVFVCIITDGEENSSREFSKTQIKEMIEHQRTKYSWEFVFIGANMDAFTEAGSMGIAFAASYDATAKGIGSAFLYSCDLSTQYRTTGNLDNVAKNVKLDS